MVVEDLCDKGLTFTLAVPFPIAIISTPNSLIKEDRSFLSLLDLSWFCRCNWIDDLGSEHLSCLIDNS